MKIFELFRRSPFEPLEEMMAKVKECAHGIEPLFEALLSENREEMLRLKKEISHLEFEADKIKDSIRSSLPRSIFLSVAREDILHILANEDSVADASEDVAVLMSLKREIKVIDELKEPVRELVRQVLSVVDMAYDVIHELPVLSDTSFGGPEAQRVITMIDKVCDMEHHSDETQKEIARIILNNEDKLSPGDLWVWLNIIRKTGDIANYAEKVCNQVRLLLSK